MAQRLRVYSLARIFKATFAIVFGLVLFQPPLARAQGYQEIHHFARSDGYHPHAGLTIDAGGKLYGTTFQGGSADYGTVFRLSRAGTGWVLNMLYSFQGPSDGVHPAARVVFGPDGALYGTTSQGGDMECDILGCGTVFRLQPPPTTCKTVVCTWTKTTIHVFEGRSHGFDGRVPVGDLIFDSAGNMYGVTEHGGQYDYGMVYQLTRSGGGWTASTLYSFTNSFGLPQSGVTFGADGDLYGTVNFAYHFWGGVYRLVPSGS